MANPENKIMLFAVCTYSTRLSPAELDTIVEACQVGENLDQCKADIYAFVESRMAFIAPNLSAIVGPSIAAKLTGIAGGLMHLSRIPSSNLMLLGAQHKTLSGFSHTTMTQHAGIIFYSDMVQNLPKDIHRRAARLIANKATLAARIDAAHNDPDGRTGRELSESIEKVFEKWQEPPPVKQVKALPAPVEPPRKRRGGRRVRKMKQRLGMTEVRRAANRMTFGEVRDFRLV